MKPTNEAQQTALVAYAQAYQLESQAWQVANERDAFESETYREERDRLDRIREDAMTAYVEAGGVIFDRTIMGYSDDTNHYAIDDALRAEFGRDLVNPDSESEQLFVYTSSVYEAAVLQFLKDKFPGLKTSVSDMDEQEIPVISNWPQAREFLRKQGIELITRDYSYIVPEKTEEQIDELVEEAMDALAKTGLNQLQALNRIVIAWKERQLPRATTLSDFLEGTKP